MARTLERALETKLAAQQQAERDLLAARARRPVRLTDEELAWLSRAGADVRAVFAAPSTTFRERKQLLRAIISEVVVTVDTQARTAALRIIWQGGQQVHRTHGEVIAVRAQRDHAALRPLPATPYVVADRHLRRVGKDCLVSFAASLYSTGPAHQLRRPQGCLCGCVHAAEQQHKLLSTENGGSVQ